MKAAHRGSNHGVRNLATNGIEFALQNHAFAVCGESLEGTGLAVTHTNLNDGTVEGVAQIITKFIIYCSIADKPIIITFQMT